MTPLALPASVQFRRVNGLSLETAVAGPTGGPLVILLHGFPDAWQGWHFQISALAEAGFRVLAPNQRGYGASEKPPGVHAYDLDLLAQDVRALAATEGRTRFSLVGHDWGGMVAWWASARFPSRVTRLAVINAPHPGAFHGYVRRRPSQLLRSWYVAAFQAPWLPETLLRAHDFALLFRSMKSTTHRGVFDESDRRYLLQGWRRRGALTAMLNYYRALVRRRPQSLRVPVPVPTLILYGRRDPTEEPGLILASQALCPACRVIEFPDARHWPHREIPAVVNGELLRFLSTDLDAGQDTLEPLSATSKGDRERRGRSSS